MNDKELANHYKILFSKSRKLIVHYEEELKQLKIDKNLLKEKLKEYESGKIKIFILFPNRRRNYL